MSKNTVDYRRSSSFGFRTLEDSKRIREQSKEALIGVLEIAGSTVLKIIKDYHLASWGEKLGAEFFSSIIHGFDESTDFITNDPLIYYEWRTTQLTVIFFIVDGILGVRFDPSEGHVEQGDQQSDAFGVALKILEDIISEYGWHYTEEYVSFEEGKLAHLNMEREIESKEDVLLDQSPFRQRDDGPDLTKDPQDLM